MWSRNGKIWVHGGGNAALPMTYGPYNVATRDDAAYVGMPEHYIV